VRRKSAKGGGGTAELSAAFGCVGHSTLLFIHGKNIYSSWSRGMS
jgi:hypothetical protein